jgi:hypothetical protein
VRFRLTVVIAIISGASCVALRQMQIVAQWRQKMRCARRTEAFSSAGTPPLPLLSAIC